MLFKDYCDYLEKIQAVSSRNEMTVILAELISNLNTDDIKPAMYLLLGRLVPKYVPLEFNFSTKLALRGLDNIVDGNEENYAQKTYNELGDIGLTVERVLETHENKEDQKNLSIDEVHSKLCEIANAGGSGSQMQKIEKFQNLISQTSPIEGKYIGRMVIGKIRLGLSEKTILDSLSWYKTGDKSIRTKIERAFGVRSDIGEIADLVIKIELDNLIEELEKLSIKPGTPIASKLVEREKNTEAILDRMKNVYVQPKLDGLRAQIHVWNEVGKDGKTNRYSQIYSRNQENMSDMFPDLVEAAKELEVDSIVLDSEAIGYNTKTGEYLPFQETIQRKRKHGVSEKAEEIPVKALVFDVLFLNGEDITQKPVEERVEVLKKITEEKNNSSKIEMLESLNISDADELNEYFEKCVASGLEGIIVKKFGTIYEPGTRNFDWIKLKASSKTDMVDTIDAVVMGYYFGTGARSKFGIGAILIGIFDEMTGQVKSVAKVGTGITDSQFVTMKEDFSGLVVENPPSNYLINNVLKPDVYLDPKIVVEVEADEVTRSKMHTAAMDENGRGLSMRFPRLKKWNRKDKDVDQTTTEKELLRLFELNK